MKVTLIGEYYVISNSEKTTLLDLIWLILTQEKLGKKLWPPVDNKRTVYK